VTWVSACDKAAHQRLTVRKDTTSWPTIVLSLCSNCRLWKWPTMAEQQQQHQQRQEVEVTPSNNDRWTSSSSQAYSNLLSRAASHGQCKHHHEAHIHHRHQGHPCSSLPNKAALMRRSTQGRINSNSSTTGLLPQVNMGHLQSTS
jgi:hypothetical protein